MAFQFSEYNGKNFNEQLYREMDKKIIKLEVAFGSDRQHLVIKRNEDLYVSDLMEDIVKIYGIPMEHQVIFHKGTNICEHPKEKLEVFGILNNQKIRINRDSDLPRRSPRSTNSSMTFQSRTSGLDPISYLKEISPQRVPDPTPYQIQMYNQLTQRNQNTVQPMIYPNDVLKLYASSGSSKEYILVHGQKPLRLSDLKNELNRVFKIAPEMQSIVYRGKNLHEFLDETSLETFGLENNSPILVWQKGNPEILSADFRFPTNGNNSYQMISPRSNMSSNNTYLPPIDSSLSSEILKIEVQHGSDRHSVILKNSNGLLTVLDLENELEKITSVPAKDQRIYFKSQELDLTPFKNLKECGLVNNSFVKLVGEPSKMRYSNIFGRLNPTTKSSNDTSSSHQFFNGFNVGNHNTYNPNFQRFSPLSNGHTNYMNHGGINQNLVNNHNMNFNSNTNFPNNHQNNMNQNVPGYSKSPINQNINTHPVNGLTYNNAQPITNTVNNAPIHINNNADQSNSFNTNANMNNNHNVF